MKAANTALAFFIILSSCGRKKCNVSDLSQLNWQQVNDHTSWYTCDGSGKTLFPGDEVNISFLGIADTSFNIIPGFNDAEMLKKASNVLTGPSACNDQRQDAAIRRILPLMARNTQYYVLYELKPFIPPARRKLMIFFHSSLDSLKVFQWLSSQPYSDSIHFTSSSETLRNMLASDSVAITQLPENPLPHIGELFVSSAYISRMDSLEAVLLKNPIVSNVERPKLDAAEVINAHLRSNSRKYALAAVFKVKT